MVDTSTSNQSDLDLMAAIQRGDPQAFGMFYDRYSARILGMIIRIVGPTGGAEDVLQEVFAEIWRKKDQFHPQRGAPIAWLILVARSRALDRRRNIAREADRARIEGGQSIADSAAELVAQSETTARACQALGSLPNDQRELIQLAFFDGLSHSEIADRTNIALGTVKTRIRTGIREMRRVLIGCEG